MKQIDCERAWALSWLKTPMGLPEDRVRQAHKLRDPEHLADVPGVNLKTRELGSDGFPAAFGKLAAHDEAKNEAVVISKPDCLNNDLKCLWVGTIAEYLSMWRVD